MRRRRSVTNKHNLVGELPLIVPNLLVLPVLDKITTHVVTTVVHKTREAAKLLTLVKMRMLMLHKMMLTKLSNSAVMISSPKLALKMILALSEANNLTLVLKW